jgi:hypothetical protein
MSTSVTEFAIVKRIMNILKLDEAGKISKFFESIVKDAKRAIAQLESNKKSLALQYEIDVDQHNEKIEDAVGVVESAYDNVTLENVKTNADIEKFKYSYLDNVAAAEYSLVTAQKKLEKYKENYTKQIEQIDEQIAKYQARIDKIVSLK